MDVSLGRSLVVAAVLGALVRAPCPAQDVGSIIGTIRDLEAGRAVVGVSVRVEGTQIFASTNGEGRYHLLNVSPGVHTLRISAPGYATLVEQIRVSPGRMIVAHYHLPMLAVMIERLVITGERADEGGARVGDDTRAQVTATTLADIIEQAVPGVEVVRGSGQVGAGTRLRVRGATSLEPAFPLIYVDGMRVEYAGSSIGASPAAPSILDLINPRMIEKVEFRSGAEAAEFGLGAQNGVILITTRKGRR